MTADSIFLEIKQALSGRPGQAIVLGVCQAVAKRWNREVWVVRAITIAVGLFWTLPVIAVYIVLGFVLAETETRTRGFFTGMGILIRETAEKLFATLGQIFGSGAKTDSRSREY